MLVQSRWEDWTLRDRFALLACAVFRRRRCLSWGDSGSSAGDTCPAGDWGAACCGACCCCPCCCAIAAPARSSVNTKLSLEKSFMNASWTPLYLVLLLIDAFVFVLPQLPGLDLGLPARAVALAPLAAAIGERVVVPGLGVALSLVAAFAFGNLLAFAASG